MSLYDKLREYRLDNSLPWFTKAWDLNGFVIRSNSVGQWDDQVVLITHDDANRPVVLVTTATSDAWEGEFMNPTHPDGCVWIRDQHVKAGWKLGAHKGRVCLRQNQPFSCVRWPPSLKSIPTVSQLEARPSFMGNQGTHWHDRASNGSPAKPLRDDSEGCVVSLYKHEHAASMELVRVQLSARGADTVSPTFLNKRAIGL